MTEITRADTDLVVENRQLRQALETLLDELETNGSVDTNRVRERMPDRDQNGIRPPWEREGYSSKEEWQEDLRNGGEM